MATMYPSSDGYIQQDNAPCHKAQNISNWILEHDNKFTVKVQINRIKIHILENT